MVEKKHVLLLGDYSKWWVVEEILSAHRGFRYPVLVVVSVKVDP